MWKHDLNGESEVSEGSESRKLYDNVDVTFRILLITDETGQARSDLSESVCC